MDPILLIYWILRRSNSRGKVSDDEELMAVAQHINTILEYVQKKIEVTNDKNKEAVD